MSKAAKGFGALDKAQRSAIAAMGGAAVKPENRSFSKNRALAGEAGRKGGRKRQGGRASAAAAVAVPAPGAGSETS